MFVKLYSYDVSVSVAYCVLFDNSFCRCVIVISCWRFPPGRLDEVQGAFAGSLPFRSALEILTRGLVAGR